MKCSCETNGTFIVKINDDCMIHKFLSEFCETCGGSIRAIGGRYGQCAWCVRVASLSKTLSEIADKLKAELR
jgi:hypothetical protein